MDVVNHTATTLWDVDLTQVIHVRSPGASRFGSQTADHNDSVGKPKSRAQSALGARPRTKMR
jgi:hypothetical protein